MNRKPGWGVRPIGFIETEHIEQIDQQDSPKEQDEQDTSETEAIIDQMQIESDTNMIPSDFQEERLPESIPVQYTAASSQNSGGNPSFSALSLLPVFPEGLKWNEAREKWTTWRPLAVRLLELRKDIRTQREKETILIARGGSMIQDIAFAQRPAPGEISEPDMSGEVPVFDNLLKRCDHYFTINSHVAIDIERFRNAKQENDETFCSFIARLRRLGNLCAFGGDMDLQLKMQILSGAKDRKLLIQQGILYDKSLMELETYAMRLEMSRDMMEGKESTHVIKENPKPDEEAVSALREQRFNRFHRGEGRTNNSGRERPSGNAQRFLDRNRSQGKASFGRAPAYHQDERKPCTRCARTHAANNCPAWNRKCNNCGRLNHFGAVCRQQKRTVNQVYSDPVTEKVNIEPYEWE